MTVTDHGARSTRAFDDQVGWLAVRCDQSAVAELIAVAKRDLRPGDELDGGEATRSTG
jgi:hypothetical protein